MADSYNFEDTTVATVGSLNKVYRYLVNKDNSLAKTVAENNTKITEILKSNTETGTVIGNITDAQNSINTKIDGLNTQITDTKTEITNYLDTQLTNCVYYSGSTLSTTTSDSIKSISITNSDNTALAITGKALDDGNITSDTTSGSSTTNVTPALYVDGGIRATSGILGAKVYNAVWNDISDAITVQEDLIPEPGYCYYYNGEKYNKTNKYCTKGILGIHSDTAGFKVGKKHISNELDIAIGGYVLAHVDKEYKSGTPLTCTKNGYLTKMKRIDVILFPERLVATYWKPETLEEWGSENEKVAVNGRHWVKVI